MISIHQASKIRALDELLQLASNVCDNISITNRADLARTMRQLVSIISRAPNKYDLTADITSISNLIDELSRPKGSAADIAFSLHSRVYSIRMRIF